MGVLPDPVGVVRVHYGEEREALATNITVALAAIRMPDAEVHLRIAHRSFPAQAWAAELDATSDDGPGWREYLEQAYQHVWAKDFWAKEIYLGSGSASGACERSCRAGCCPQFRGVHARGESGPGPDEEAVGLLRSPSGPTTRNGSAGR